MLYTFVVGVGLMDGTSTWLHIVAGTSKYVTFGLLESESVGWGGWRGTLLGPERSGPTRKDRSRFFLVDLPETT